MIKKLPVGIQTFEKIIDGNYCYVDKTPLIARLVDLEQLFHAFFASIPQTGTEKTKWPDTRAITALLFTAILRPYGSMSGPKNPPVMAGWT